jgi:spore coat protein U-like protein
MRQQLLIFCRLLLASLCIIAAPQAWACTVSGTTNIALGTHHSTTLAAASQTTSAASGITCPTLLQLAVNNYMAVKISGSTLNLTGPNGAQIPFNISISNGGPPIPAGSIFPVSTSTFLSLLSSTSGGAQFFITTLPSANIPAGPYTATLNVDWYYSICTIGLLGACVTRVENDGYGTGEQGWGTPKRGTVTLSLEVKRGCTINAPNVSFGTRPISSAFDIISQTITVRCSVGEEYKVALNDGQNVLDGSRSMLHSGGVYKMKYDVFKGTSGSNRWGSNSAEIWSSKTASASPGIHNGVSTQSFQYRAQVSPEQSMNLIAGNYKDTLTLTVTF